MSLLKPKILSSFVLAVALLIIPIGSNGEFVTGNLAKAQFTTHINKHNPVDNIRRLDTGFKSVYFFVDVRDCNGCDIEHEWWYKGRKVGSVEGEIKSDRYRWWSKKTLTKDFLGDLTVKVILDGNEVYSKTVTYYKASRKQKQSRPIKHRVQIQEADECELQLRYFSGKLKDEPEDTYYKFMLKKWGKRCLPE